MALKTYVNHRPGSVAWTHLEDGIEKHDTLPFVNGVLATDDEALQKYVEALPAYKQAWITIKNDARADLADKAIALEGEARAAEKAAADAEYAAEAPKRLRVLAEAAKKDAADAVAALADFDKTAKAQA